MRAIVWIEDRGWMFTDSQIGYTWCLATVFADFARWNVDKQHGESRSVRRLLGRTARHLLREYAGLFPPTAAVRVHTQSRARICDSVSTPFMSTSELRPHSIHATAGHVSLLTGM